jgi:hypothetical protein
MVTVSVTAAVFGASADWMEAKAVSIADRAAKKLALMRCPITEICAAML